MPRTRIKICGVRDVETVLTAAAAGADAIGLVFVPRSPRCIDADQANRILAALPAFVEPVGLFADMRVEEVQQVIQQTGLKTVQLHGREGPGYAAQLKGCRIIKTVSFDSDHLHDRLSPWYNAPCNLSAILLDTPPDDGASLTGGSGRSFDWDTLAAMAANGMFENLPPLILAGGLTPDNVGRAVRTCRPYGVDVSSGVEAERGVKDMQKIIAFCHAVREADHAFDPLGSGT